ncbi:MAG TPA: hypothetical protein VLE46_15300, partial [Nitrospira sp.]|nr:hypothetical protein [Nitrospira sp.]
RGRRRSERMGKQTSVRRGIDYTITVPAGMHRRWSEPGSGELSEPVRRGTEEESPWPLNSRNK